MQDYRPENLSLKAYKVYVALKLHFTSNYDFFKYHGKTNVKPNQYFSRNDKIYFRKLSQHTDPFGLLLANISTIPEIWIGDIISNEGEARYLKMTGAIQSLYYNLERDLLYLSLDSFKPKANKLPEVINISKQNKISYESMIVLVDILGLMPTWKKHYDNIVYLPKLQLIEKYTPFVVYDKKRVIKLLESKWND